jgi:hypothetical protein
VKERSESDLYGLLVKMIHTDAEKLRIQIRKRIGEGCYCWRSLSQVITKTKCNFVNAQAYPFPTSYYDSRIYE